MYEATDFKDRSADIAMRPLIIFNNPDWWEKKKKKKPRAGLLNWAAEIMSETEQGQLIPQRLRETKQEGAAHFWVRDLAEQPWEVPVTALPLDNSRSGCMRPAKPAVPGVAETSGFATWRREKEGWVQGNCVCGAGRGRPVSSSLTLAREMLEWDRRYARHRVASWSAASCKTWTFTDWHSSISYIKGPFLWSGGMVFERRMGSCA